MGMARAPVPNSRSSGRAGGALLKDGWRRATGPPRQRIHWLAEAMPKLLWERTQTLPEVGRVATSAGDASSLLYNG